MVHMNQRLARIVIDPNICFGKACIRGTRIWVSLILDFLASGMTNECLFRRSRPAKPEEVGRLFRPKPATQTGAKRPPIGAKRRWF